MSTLQESFAPAPVDYVVVYGYGSWQSDAFPVPQYEETPKEYSRHSTFPAAQADRDLLEKISALSNSGWSAMILAVPHVEPEQLAAMKAEEEAKQLARKTEAEARNARVAARMAVPKPARGIAYRVFVGHVCAGKERLTTVDALPDDFMDPNEVGTHDTAEAAIVEAHAMNAMFIKTNPTANEKQWAMVIADLETEEESQQPAAGEPAEATSAS